MFLKSGGVADVFENNVFKLAGFDTKSTPSNFPNFIYPASEFPLNVI